MATALTTPDGRYIIVRGRLWRATDPRLTEAQRTTLVKELAAARRAVKDALRSENPEELAAARAAVHVAKVALGERGPPWWGDAEKDFNRYLVKNSPYAQWYESVSSESDD